MIPILAIERVACYGKPVGDPVLQTVFWTGRFAEAWRQVTGHEAIRIRFSDVALPTVTTKDRFALVEPQVDGQGLDIRFRMLQPHELARAMSFDAGYEFAGNRSERVKQIGNAWAVRLAEASSENDCSGGVNRPREGSCSTSSAKAAATRNWRSTMHCASTTWPCVERPKGSRCSTRSGSRLAGSATRRISGCAGGRRA